MRGAQWMDIRSDRQKRLSYVEPGKKYHMDQRTAKRYAESPERAKYTLSEPKATKMDPFKPMVDEWLEEAPYSAKRILEKLREMGFDRGYSIVKAYVSSRKMDLNDPFIPPQRPPGADMRMDRYEKREEVKANIDFEGLQRAHPYDDVESLLELIVDVLCSTSPTMRIAGDALPTEIVKERFRKLDSSHIEYIIEAMSQTTTKINNIRAYLLTALYNAPVTMGPYYSAAVRHDFS